MTSIYLVTESYIREHTPINGNVDTKLITPNIAPAQDMFIQDILGSTFYDALLLSYDAQTLTADETSLVLLIKPVLAYRAIEISLPFIHTTISNKGPVLQSGDNMASVDNTTLSYLRNEIKNRAEFYTARLDRYLQINGSKFPLFISPGNADMQPDTTKPYDGDFATYPADCNNNQRCNGFNGFFNPSNLY